MMEKRPFGRTGHMSTVTLFGAASLSRATPAEADRVLDLRLELLPKVLDAASRYTIRPGDDAMLAMLEKQRLTSLFGLGPASIR